MYRRWQHGSPALAFLGFSLALRDHRTLTSLCTKTGNRERAVVALFLCLLSDSAGAKAQQNFGPGFILALLILGGAPECNLYCRVIPIHRHRLLDPEF